MYIIAPHADASSNGGRSSAVEPRIVVPVVVGSNPIVHPVPFRESHGRGHFLYISLAPYITSSYENWGQ